MSYVGFVLSSGVQLSVCGEQPIVLVTTWIIWGFLWDSIHLTSNSIECNSAPLLEAFFDEKRYLLDPAFLIIFLLASLSDATIFFPLFHFSHVYAHVCMLQTQG